MKTIAEKLKQLRERFESTFFFRHVLRYVLIVCVFVAQWMMIQLSCQGIQGILQVEFRFFLLESSLLIVLAAFVALCTGRWWIGLCVTAIFSFIYGAANYYVIELHGTQLTLRSLADFATAMDVIGSYRLTLNKYVLTQTALLLACLLAIYIVRRIERTKQRYEPRELLLRAGTVLACGICIFCGFFASGSAGIERTLVWDWKVNMQRHGCLSMAVEDAKKGMNVVTVPEYYSAQAAAGAAQTAESSGQERGARPDIIFILNETYYDLSVVRDFQTDADPFAPLNERDDLIRGYAVSPNVGGGTNCSEYELLTGNSLILMPGITPFQSLSMRGADSVVSRLEAQGYSTLGAHSENADNYYRARCYPDIGFDRIHFDGDFTKEFHAQRHYATDESLYDDFIGWYENMGEGPRFAYLLTIQNHAEYDQCDSSADTVHVLDDLGVHTDQANEFLTGISMSSEALDELLDYFAAGDRPVMVCMVGDHGPSMASPLASGEFAPGQRQLLLRSVPYVVWANFELEPSVIPERVGMYALSACVLASAGVELSGYEQYIVDMCRTAPVMLSTGDWYDAEGGFHAAQNEQDLPRVLQNYLCLEYNNLCGGDGRLENFFCSE